MTAFPSHPAWDFVTRLYAAPGVAPACLDLQERHGIDVTFMLFCLWRGSVCAMPLGEHVPVLAAAAREWHETIVLPVRAARRKLKAKADTSQRPVTRALYKTVLAAEIDSEHAELLMLAERADALCGPWDGEGTAATITENLAAFLRSSGIALTKRDSRSVATILGAAGASDAAG